MPKPIADETAGILVGDAVAAPSMHNAQPWVFRHRRAASVIEVRADPSRTMPHADPDRRALHLGCGAALFNLRVAAADAGLRCEVELLPDPSDPDLVAAVRLVQQGEGDVVLAALHPAVARRHTSRSPFEDAAIPGEVKFALVGEAAGEGARLVFPGERQNDMVLDLVDEAEAAAEEGGDPDERRWTRVGLGPETGTDDGVSYTAVGPRSRHHRGSARDFARGTGRERATTDFEQHPQMALVTTEQDGPAQWLAAGQATERVLLAATLAHLSTGLATQPLEHPRLRRLLTAPAGGRGCVQMVMRLGYGPPDEPTRRRRPVREVLEEVP
ncbi:Acg family FMN-binding oxidoreductase [Streptomyces sp. NPDC059740]|uniref:Acg family FMN-binding oxidoreductase n=1 Tax=Streptomyces sp. NPDC059740 TaxID=3346926 RepID=UPI003661FC86